MSDVSTEDNSHFRDLVRLLGSDDAVVRMGGLLGLESLARCGYDSGLVYKLIGAYARHHVPTDLYEPKAPSAEAPGEVTLAATAASRRTVDYELAIDLLLQSSEVPMLDLRGCLIVGRAISDLERINLSNCFLPHCNFSGTLRGVDLSNAKLVNCHLEDASFVAGELSGVMIESSVVRSVEIVDCALVGGALTGVRMSSSSFKASNLRGFSFLRSRLMECSFDNCDLDLARGLEAELDNVTITNCTTESASWIDASWSTDEE